MMVMETGSLCYWQALPDNWFHLFCSFDANMASRPYRAFRGVIE